MVKTTNQIKFYRNYRNVIVNVGDFMIFILALLHNPRGILLMICHTFRDRGRSGFQPGTQELRDEFPETWSNQSFAIRM
jgi:hypothetical protein